LINKLDSSITFMFKITYYLIE